MFFFLGGVFLLSFIFHVLLTMYCSYPFLLFYYYLLFIHYYLFLFLFLLYFGFFLKKEKTLDLYILH